MKNQMPDTEIHAVVLKAGNAYHMAFSSMPDLHQLYGTKEAALLAARRNLEEHGHDPNLVLDLTNAQPHELTDYLR